MTILIQIGGLAAFLLGVIMLVAAAMDFAKYKAMILPARRHPVRLEWPSVVIFAFMGRIGCSHPACAPCFRCCHELA